MTASEIEKPGMLEVWDYHRFVRANMHILAKDPSALLQQALNFPDTTVICREAGEHLFAPLSLLTANISLITLLSLHS